MVPWPTIIMVPVTYRIYLRSLRASSASERRTAEMKMGGNFKDCKIWREESLAIAEDNGGK